MRKLSFVLAIAVAFAARAQRPITFDDLASIRRIGAPKVSPDGKWVAYHASTIDMAANYRRAAIYLVPASGGPSRKISDGAKQDEQPEWSPDGRTIAYVSNSVGAAHQIFLYDVTSGATRQLTNLPGGAAIAKWTADGSAVVVVSDIYPECGVEPACIKDKTEAAEKKTTKARTVDRLLFRRWNTWQEPTRAHIVYYPLSGAPRDLTPGAFDAPPFSVGGGDEFEVSPDGRELAYARNTDERQETSTNSDIFIVPMSGGDAKRITTRKGADTSPRYSPDGKWIAWRSQVRAGFEADLFELWLYNRATGATTRLAADFPNWIESVAWAPDSRTLYVTAPEKGRMVIYEVMLDGKYKQIHSQGSADAIDVSRDGKTIFFDQSSLRRPTDIYSLTRDGRLTKVTQDNDALMQSLSVGQVSDIWWTGAEGANVQGHLVTPPGFDASKKYPALVLVHGGPQGAWNDAWSYRWNPQIFASRGYVVLMPNPRGSTGFGQKFIDEISGDWGGKVYTDVMNGVDKLVTMPWVDASRLGAAGGSYGGYMVNWMMGHTDRFKAYVSHAGVYNLISSWGVTEELFFNEWEFQGTPWENPEMYERWSPYRFAKNFKTPTLVSHGELDFRVPIGEGFQLFTTLQRRGIPSKMLYFPDEGHWVLKPQNSKVWFATVGDWFDQWLK